MAMSSNPSSMAHPLVVPSPDAPSQGYASEQVGGDDQLIPAKTGEYIIPEPVVRAKVTQFFDNLIKKVLQDQLPPEATKAEVDSQDPSNPGGTGTPQTGYKWGGAVHPAPVLTMPKHKHRMRNMVGTMPFNPVMPSMIPPPATPDTDPATAGTGTPATGFVHGGEVPERQGGMYQQFNPLNMQYPAVASQSSVQSGDGITPSPIPVGPPNDGNPSTIGGPNSQPVVVERLWLTTLA